MQSRVTFFSSNIGFSLSFSSFFRYWSESTVCRSIDASISFSTLILPSS